MLQTEIAQRNQLENVFNIECQNIKDLQSKLTAES